MCFSPEASFSASVALVAVGVVLITRLYDSRKILLALIPIFFGIQQFAEGFVWVGLENESFPAQYTLAAQYVYSFFAQMFWPLWVPLAFAVSERVAWRRLLMLLLIIGGSGFFFRIGYDFVVHGDVHASIREHSIYYGSVPLVYQLLYGLVAMLPFFISSIPKMWVLGTANLIAFIVAGIWYNYAFISVWCLAAAICAIGLFFLLKKTVEV